MIGLTDQQASCLAYLRDYCALYGTAPTFRKIMVAMGLQSTSGVSRILDALAVRGCIRRISKHARAIEILDVEQKCFHCGHVAGSDSCRAAAAAASTRTYSSTPAHAVKHGAGDVARHGAQSQ